MIPGLFVALLLRFDLKRAQADPNIAEYLAFPKPFFLVNLVAYGLGLLVTVGVMFFFKAAQVHIGSYCTVAWLYVLFECCLSRFLLLRASVVISIYSTG